jgi:hypothetical protein
MTAKKALKIVMDTQTKTRESFCGCNVAPLKCDKAHTLIHTLIKRTSCWVQCHHRRAIMSKHVRADERPHHPKHRE